MKVCKRCSRGFEEEDIDISPAAELADIYLPDLGVEDINDLCPQCREEMGVIDILGFGQ